MAIKNVKHNYPYPQNAFPRELQSHTFSIVFFYIVILISYDHTNNKYW